MQYSEGRKKFQMTTMMIVVVFGIVAKTREPRNPFYFRAEYSVHGCRSDALTFLIENFSDNFELKRHKQDNLKVELTGPCSPPKTV